MTPNTKLLTSAALLACAASASAQSVTIYGIIDAAVEHVTNVGSGGAGLTRMPNQTGSLPSRIGFRGAEDLGGGLRAVYTLESGFGPDSGTFNQGGRAWGRQAWVGLAGPWGTVSFGRNYTMYFWSLLDADVIGPHTQGIGVFDPYINNARTDNSVAYLGKFGGLTVGGTVSVGRDTVAGNNPAATNCPGESAIDRRACREWSGMLKYDSAQWGAAAAVDTQYGGAGAFAGLTSSALTDRRTSVNGYYKLGTWRFGGGLIRRDNEGSPRPRSDLWYGGASYVMTSNVTLDASLSSYKVRDTGDEAKLLVLRSTYQMSRRTAVYASVARIENDGNLAVSVSGGQVGSNPVPGGAQSGVAVGIRHVF